MDKSQILIVGAGTVGKATGFGLIKLGHQVIFLDRNPEILVPLMNQNYNTISELKTETEFEIAFICVETNLDTAGRFELEPLKSALIEVSRHSALNNRSCFVGLCSTLFPGTTRNLITELEKLGFYDSHLTKIASTPEFLRDRSAEFDFLSGPVRAVGSTDPEVRKVFRKLLESTCKNFLEFDTYEEAEIFKIAHNLSNIVEITFWNQIKILADYFSVNPLKIKKSVALSAESKLNPNYAYASGIPIGGPCLPKDLIGTLAEANKLNLNIDFLEGTARLNNLL
jgi:nucleotide sugar dehydrogenase